MDTLVMIMAGGRGERLHPLTSHRAKPAVPFGGNYRIIDFVLSNFINSGFLHIKVLTQYLSHSLLLHLPRGFNFGSITEHYVDAIPAQQHSAGFGWYQGTADSIYRNLNIVHDERPQHVAIFGGDHVYKMDVRQMLDFHRGRSAACTIATLPFDREQAAGQFGILEVDENWRVIGFEEKPSDPKPIPGMPDKALVSMGNYIFAPDVLFEVLSEDHDKPGSKHDFGGDVIPAMLADDFPVYAYNFLDNQIPGENDSARGYWRDIGTLDAFYEANMDLRSVHPGLNLYNPAWPIRSANLHYQAAKFVFDENERRGFAIDSLVANGAIVSGGAVRQSVVFANVFVHSYAEVTGSILMQHCAVGRHARLKNVICDKGVTVEDGAVIGEDLDFERGRFRVSPNGVVVVPKGTVVRKDGSVDEEAVRRPAGTLRPRAHQPGSVSVP